MQDVPSCDTWGWSGGGGCGEPCEDRSQTAEGSVRLQRWEPSGLARAALNRGHLCCFKINYVRWGNWSIGFTVNVC